MGAETELLDGREFRCGLDAAKDVVTILELATLGSDEAEHDTLVAFGEQPQRLEAQRIDSGVVISQLVLAQFVTAHPEKAADIYLKANGSRIDRALLLKVIKSPEVSFKIEPQNTLGLGQFMHRVGAIKTEPKALTDYFFDSPRTATGS